MTSANAADLFDEVPDLGESEARCPEASGLDASQSPTTEKLWCLRSPCALSPVQLAMALAVAALVSLLISVGFWMVGATWVMPFACVETICLSLAFVMYARHTQDVEEVALVGSSLVIHQRWAGKVHVEEWPAAWVRVSCGFATGHLIEIRWGGRCVRVGKGLAWSQRLRAAQGMAQALRRMNDVSN